MSKARNIADLLNSSGVTVDQTAAEREAAQASILEGATYVQK